MKELKSEKAAGEDIKQKHASGFVFYSSKFLQKETEFNQSWEGKGLYNILSTTEGSGEPVYYVYARKDAKSQKYQEIDIFLLN